MKTRYNNKINRLGRVMLCATLFATGASRLQAQDQPHYSLYMLHQPVINIGAMGSYDQVYGGIFFNNQMVGFDGAPIVGLIDVGAPIAKTSLLLGGTVSQEKIGVHLRTNASFNAAYRIKLNIKHYLSLGLGLGAQYTNSRFSQLMGNTPDPIFQQDYQYWSPTVRFGAYYFTENLYVGAAVSNVISNKLTNGGAGTSNRFNVNARDMSWILQAGYQVKFGKGNWKFQPSVLFKYVVGSPLQFDVNAHFLFKNALGFGASYRSLGTLVILADYNIKNKVIIGYSVNFGLQHSRSNFFNGHEIYLGFKLNKKGANAIPVDVPRF